MSRHNLVQNSDEPLPLHSISSSKPARGDLITAQTGAARGQYQVNAGSTFGLSMPDWTYVVGGAIRTESPPVEFVASQTDMRARVPSSLCA
jgi:hypothetical protein